ncbi:MAG: hypothetical protein RSD36_08870 [Terrisporobacter sp.]
MESYQIEFKGKEAPSNFNMKIKINEIGGVNSNIEDILKEVNLYDDKGEKIASHRYDEDGISIGFYVDNVIESHEKMEKEGLNPTPIILSNPNVKFFFEK